MDGPDDDVDLEVTDLRPVGERGRDADRGGDRRISLKRAWRWGALAVSLALLGALILSVFPVGGGLLRTLQRFGRASTPTVVSSIQISSEIDQTPLPTTVIRTPPAPPLALAPASCAATAPALMHVGPPQWGAAVGQAPVWLAGMSGAYPTLRLGREASANAYDWSAPYTQFGWPAPIGIVLRGSFNQQVRLTSWNVSTGEVASFGLVQAGDWGAPSRVAQTFLLNPSDPVIPAGGEDSTGVFWYGYAFFPQAGCYTLDATWPGGSWQATISAGR